MSGLTHHIRKSTFTIQVDTEANALALRPVISETIKKKLFQVMEQEFSEWDVPSTIIRIPKLELALGNFSPSSIETELEERLRASLRQSLKALLSNVSDQQAGRYTFMDAPDASLLKVRTYLEHGVFPWWADCDSSFSRLADEMMQSHPGRIVLLMKELAKQDYIVKRFVYQLEEALLIRFLSELNIPFNEFVLTYIKDLQKSHRSKSIVQASSVDFEKVIWLFALSFLLTDRGTTFNKKMFLKWNIEKLANRYQLTYESLLFFLADCIRKENTGQYSLLAVLNELKEEHIASTPRINHSNRLTKAHANELMILKEYLSNDVWPMEEERSPHELFALIDKSDNAQLAQMMQTVSQSEAVLTRIENSLPLKKVVYILEPSEHEFIVAYVSNLKLTNRKQPVIKAPVKEFERAIWRLILNYLTKNRGTYFNRKSFVKWNLEHIAAKYNVKYQALLDFMGQSLMDQSHESDSSFSTIMTNLLQDLRSEYAGFKSEARRQGFLLQGNKEPEDINVARAKNVAEDDSHSDWASILEKQDELYAFDYWMRYGALPCSFTPSKPKEWFDRLLENYPTDVVNALDDFINRGSPFDAMFANSFSPSSTQHLIGLLLDRKGSSTNGRAAFLESILHYASQSKSAGRFYGKVILAIVKSQMIDLEEFQNSSKLDGDNIHSPEYYRERLQQSIVGWSKPNQTVKAALVDYISLYSSDCKAYLTMLAQSDPALPSKLVLGQREDLMETLIGVLQPENASIINEYYHWIKEAVARGLLPGTLEKLSIDLLLVEQLLLDRNRIFNVARFIQNTFRTLFERVDRPISAEAYQALKSISGHTSTFQLLIKSALHATQNKKSTLAAIVNPLLPSKENLPVLNKRMAGKLFGYLLFEQRDSGVSESVLHHALVDFISRSPLMSKRFVRKYILHQQNRARWVRLLPEPILTRLIGSADYRGYRSMMRWIELLSNCYIPRQNTSNEFSNSNRWVFLFDYLTSYTENSFREEQYLLNLLLFTVRDFPETQTLQNVVYTLDMSLTDSHTNEKIVLRKVRQMIERKPIDKVKNPKTPSPKTHDTKERKKNPSLHLSIKPKFELDKIGHREPMYVKNAGLVILHVFFPKYFELLGLLSPDKKEFKDEASLFRAVHALQYLVDKRIDASEPELLLNKILCGCPLHQPISAREEMTSDETGIADGLLSGAIANWPTLKNTSVDGLRTFFSREGKVFTQNDNSWQLEVENKTVDILLDQLPWGISVVKHDWMKQPLYVKWRK